MVQIHPEQQLLLNTQFSRGKIISFLVVGCQDQKKLPETVPPQVENRPETKTDFAKKNFFTQLQPSFNKLLQKILST